MRGHRGSVVHYFTAVRITSILAFAVLAAAGCASPVQPQVTLGQPFDLKAGQSASLDNGLTLTFDRVTSDSRCPINALCIVAGEAVVVLTVSQRSGTPVEREVRTGLPPKSEAEFLSYTISLIGLAPLPLAGQIIRPEDYVATLQVVQQ